MTDQSEPSDQQVNEQQASALAVLGTTLMFAGAALLFLLMIARSPESTLSLPRFLYTNREAWLVFGGGLVAFGMLCLRRSSGPASTSPQSPFSSVVLYTRTDCPLCDEAKAFLNGHRARLPGIEEVDIDGDAGLTAEFGDWVPVVEIDGKVRFRGRIDEMLFRRLLEGTANIPSSSEQGDSA